MAATSPPSFSGLLRNHRLKAGLTQEALAERAGISARGVQELERGRTRPRAETVRLLTEALHLEGEERSALIAAARPELTASAGAAAWPPLPKPPLPPSPLVGREREVAIAVTSLRRPESRLLTLTGPGGVGKTRLALAVAAELGAEFPDGVAWVELAGVSDPELVPAAVAHVLGVRESGKQSLEAALGTALAERHALIVLDNCEQLLAAMPVVAAWLAASEHIAVLATSRTRLRLRGERELSVGPLALPDESPAGTPLAGLAGIPAVRLFLERAQAVRPDLKLTTDNAAHVAAICRRLDGLPLAIELAAARTKLLAPAALLERLDRRLPLLSGGAQDLPPRQQTMRDAIAWSHDLLTVDEQRLFRRLAVCAGGFSLEAASALGGDEPVFDLVASLCDQSLLRALEPVLDEPRFTLLETVREYALERLDASDDAADARATHAEYFLALAESAEPELTGLDQMRWLKRLEAEHDNVRAALAWAISSSTSSSIGVRMAGALWRFWWINGHYHEGRNWLESALERGGGNDAQRAKALYGAGSLATEQGDYGRAGEFLEAALEAAYGAADSVVAAFALTDLGSIARQQGAYERAVQFHERALVLRRENSDRRGIAVSLGNLGLAALHQGQYERADELLSEAASCFRDVGDLHSLVTTISNLAHAAAFAGDFARARSLVSESLTGYREFGDRQGIADDLVTLGLAMRGLGERSTSMALFLESLEHSREIGYRLGEANALHRLGLAALDDGDDAKALKLLEDGLRLVRVTSDFEVIAGLLDGFCRGAARTNPEFAAQMFGAAAALRETIGAPRPPADEADYRRSLAAVQDVIGGDRFREAETTGRNLTGEETIAMAMSLRDGIV